MWVATKWDFFWGVGGSCLVCSFVCVCVVLGACLIHIYILWKGGRAKQSVDCKPT